MPPKQKSRTKQPKKSTATKKMIAETSLEIARTRRKRRQDNSMEGSRAKQRKTCPLTAADIPDIVMAVVKALPS